MVLCQIISMLKRDVIEFFGTAVAVAKALEYRSHAAVSMWPDVLQLAVADRVRGACVRLKKRIPPQLRHDDASPEQSDAGVVPGFAEGCTE
jgi:hypothetical protein